MQKEVYPNASIWLQIGDFCEGVRVCEKGRQLELIVRRKKEKKKWLLHIKVHIARLQVSVCDANVSLMRLLRPPFPRVK